MLSNVYHIPSALSLPDEASIIYWIREPSLQKNYRQSQICVAIKTSINQMTGDVIKKREQPDNSVFILILRFLSFELQS